MRFLQAGDWAHANATKASLTVKLSSHVAVQTEADAMKNLEVDKLSDVGSNLAATSAELAEKRAAQQSLQRELKEASAANLILEQQVSGLQVGLLSHMLFQIYRCS
jgi:septal ring factor EnvC (AmiA/AmiB activator)